MKLFIYLSFAIFTYPVSGLIHSCITFIYLHFHLLGNHCFLDFYKKKNIILSKMNEWIFSFYIEVNNSIFKIY